MAVSVYRPTGSSSPYPFCFKLCVTVIYYDGKVLPSRFSRIQIAALSHDRSTWEPWEAALHITTARYPLDPPMMRRSVGNPVSTGRPNLLASSSFATHEHGRRTKQFLC